MGGLGGILRYRSAVFLVFDLLLRAVAIICLLGLFVITCFLGLFGYAIEGMSSACFCMEKSVQWRQGRYSDFSTFVIEEHEILDDIGSMASAA